MVVATSQNIWDQAFLWAFMEFLCICTKLSLEYMLPVEPFFMSMEWIQIYTSMNQNKVWLKLSVQMRGETDKHRRKFQLMISSYVLFTSRMNSGKYLLLIHTHFLSSKTIELFNITELGKISKLYIYHVDNYMTLENLQYL